MRLKRAMRMFFVVSVVILASCNTDYSKEVRQSVQDVLKLDFSAYHFWGTPVGNFGIGTMYLKSAQNVDPASISDQALIAIPDTYYSDKLTDAQKSQLFALLFPDGKVGQFSLSRHAIKGVKLEVAIPNIQNIIGANGSIDFNKDVQVELTANQARVRKTNWTEIGRAIQRNEIQQDIKNHLQARDVMIAMNDIVLDGYTAKVTVKASTNVGLDAALKSKLNSVVGDASAKFKITSSEEGTYSIQATDTVVVATLFREIPQGVLAAADADAFPALRVPNQNLDKMREIYIRKLQGLQH